ncbi:MAG: 1-(5-phosphoribosyl)-5-[(5-phosphoribosylamino)methylideneamino]imidazole-4-carboxamide isomerase [Armatimonadetes bacterium]|nr:1-(5-phosphoribosyl)-5-[(5-phosphoribosylamino)methylideneamino]imidazole-4-carboxamide isomerase [Candidatus Hippobium faecium]
MLIIPAIDLIDGEAVRLVQGDFSKKTVYDSDPAQVAKKWQSAGAELIHLVDLEGSRQGHPIECDTVRKIKSSVDIPLEIGGGVRRKEDIEKFLEAGADYVILGTSVASDEEFAKEVLGNYGDRIVIGIDAKNGLVAVKGWEKVTDLEAVSFAKKMESFGAGRIIYTDISRDGMMQGVNVEAMKKMAESISVPVTASGGVSSYEDIIKLKEIECFGVRSAIIGKALYTGAIDLKKAIEL